MTSNSEIIRYEPGRDVHKRRSHIRTFGGHVTPAGLLCFLLCALTFSSAPSVQAGASGGAPNFRPPAQNLKQTRAPYAHGRILVKFKAAEQARGQISAGALNALSQIGGRVTRSIEAIGVHVVSTPQPIGRAIESLYRSGIIEYAEPDFRVKAIAKTPNDPSFDQLWGLKNTGQYINGTDSPGNGTPDADIDAPEAWGIRTASDSVIVGVVDTGIDYLHQDLSANMWTNPKEIPSNLIDDDGNGIVDDVFGADFVDYDGDPMDEMSYYDVYHGTHVAGTIGAKGNNGIGVAGVGWKAKVMALRFLDAYGSGWTSDAINAINYALAIKAANGYKRMILSNSWGGGGYSSALFDVIALARDQGVLFVAAAGNDYSNTDVSPTYPAGYALANIVSVGATDFNDHKPDFSNYGCSSVDLSAPGVDVYSTQRYDRYQYLSGTSMATPHVSGMAALIWSQRPTMTWKSIKSALLNSVEPKDQLKAQSMTQGRANLNKAIAAAAYSTPTIWQLTPAAARPGENITVSGTAFGATQGTGAVKVNGVDATIVSWTAGEIVATVPAATPYGTGKVTVTNGAGITGNVGACIDVSIKPVLYGHTILPHAWASGARVGEDTYIFGGQTYWGQTGLVERITLTTGRSIIDSAWAMPTPLTNTGATSIGSKIYVVGGIDDNSSTVSDQLQIFDTFSGTWSSGAALPAPRGQSAVTTDGTKVYVFGGIDSYFSVSGTTYVYNPSTNAWSTRAPKPNPAAYAGAFSYAGKAYLLGGFEYPYLGYETAIVETYSFSANQWATLPPMLNRRGAPAAIYYNGKPHALFGSYGNTSGETYAAGAWTKSINGEQALYTAMRSVSGPYLYIFGGYDQTSYQLSTNIWRIME